MDTDKIKLINQIIEKFILNPENFVLFRGEKITNKGGLHFALDDDWAKRFGDTIIKGTLPVGSKIKSITKDDFQEAYNLGFTSEQPMKSIFLKLGTTLLALSFILTSLSSVLAETTTTIYPSKYYNIDSDGKVTKHIFANGVEIATVEGTGNEAKVKYLHTDNLGSTNIVTDNTGKVVETVDYFPYGSPRIDKATGIKEQRKYIGQEYDADTGLNYLNARYYDSSTGRFLSQDPAFKDIGLNDFKHKYQRTLEEQLMNPQSLNSYSYANNNPITYNDPEGKIAFIPLIGYILSAYGVIDFGIDLYDAHTVNVKYLEQFTRQDKLNTVKELGKDAGTFAFGRFVEEGSKIAFDAITTAVEIISNKASEASKNNQTGISNESIKNNSTPNSRSFIQLQSKSQSSYAAPTSKNQNGVLPGINVNQKLSDTFNKAKRDISNIIRNSRQ